MVSIREGYSRQTSDEEGKQNCISVFYPATICLSSSSLACGFSLSRSLARPSFPRLSLSVSLSLFVDQSSRSTLLPPSPTSYRRYVGCATSLPGNRYLAGFILNGARYTVVPHTRIFFDLSFSPYRPRYRKSAASFSHDWLLPVVISHRTNGAALIDLSALGTDKQTRSRLSSLSSACK